MNAGSLNIGTVATSVAASSNDVKALAATAQSGSPASLPATEDTSWSPKNFSQNVEQFKSVVSTILDTSGKYSYDERLKAYTSLYEMSAKGKLAGMGPEDSRLSAKATFESDIGISNAKIRQQALDNRLAAQARGESTMVAHLKFVAGLSENDQKTFFTGQNGFDMAGNFNYADFDSYRNQLVAHAVHEYDRASDQTDSQRVPDGLKGDLNGMAQALKGVDPKALGSSWGAHILSLLGTDKAATSDWGDLGSAGQPFLTPKMPLAYQPGNIFTQVA